MRISTKMKAALAGFLVVGAVLGGAAAANAVPAVWSKTVNCTGSQKGYILSDGQGSRTHFHNDGGPLARYDFFNNGVYTSKAGSFNVNLSISPQSDGQKLIVRASGACKV